MNRISWLPLLTFFSMFLRISSEFKPLIFDPFTWDIYDPQNPPEYFRNAGACPADDHQEKYFNEFTSYGRNALFIHGYSRTMESMKLMNCDNGPQLSVIYHSNDKRIEFGYEIYYSKSDYIQKFSTSEYTDFRSVENIRKTFAAMRFIGYPFKRSNPTMSTSGTARDYFDNGPWYDKMGFMWISMVSIKYNHSSWTITSLSHKISGNINQMLLPCNINSMHTILRRKFSSNEKYTQTFDDYYSTTNQKKKFQGVALPSTLGNDCRINYNCVKKYNITPYIFKSPASNDIPCSDLTSIPLWYELNESQLRYLNKVLISIAKVTNSTFKVYDGVLGPLTLPLNDKLNQKPIYLHSNEDKIPIPRIIYKVVLYDTYECDTQKRFCRFGVVFVIHNQPEFPSHHKACEDKCEEWGWDSIQYGSSTRTETTRKSRYVYCCSLLGEVQKNLDIYLDKSIIIRDLKLNSFPYFDGRKRRHAYEDRREEIENMAEGLIRQENFDSKLTKDRQKIPLQSRL